ncbi:MAG: magnesium and cobalt transport protein CorA [Rikenellaceae bacterium]|nr:magnesium and cobalt transport protein CorA [Rikenellaceae bacterium]
MNKEGNYKDKAEYHLFSDRYHYYGPYRQPTKIRVIRYNEQKIEQAEVDTATEDFRHVIKEGYVNWIQVTGLADEETITRMILGFGLHPIDCKAVLTPYHAAKIDDLNHRVIIILRSCSFGKTSSVASEHIAILSKENFVVTFKEKDNRLFAPIENSIANDTMKIRSSGRIMLVAFILNTVFSQTIDAAIRVEEMLEKLDDVLLDARASKINIGKRIQQCRHANLILQKNTVPLHTEFQNIAQSEVVTSDMALRQIFDELYNQLDYVILSSKNSRELLASMRDMYAASNELRTNAIMKRLTVVATLFIPITFLVGLWGMNFRYMPELDLKYGYPAALIVIFITGICTWAYMRRNDWF